MSAGYGYQDGTWFLLKDFSIALRGREGCVELIPTGILYPELGDAPNNTLGLKVRISAGAFVGEGDFEPPVAALWQFQSDLEKWSPNGDMDLLFPSPRVVHFHDPHFQCTVKHGPGRLGWDVHCQLSYPPRENSEFPGLSVAALETVFKLDTESVEIARHDLADFRRYMAAVQS